MSTAEQEKGLAPLADAAASDLHFPVMHMIFFCLVTVTLIKFVHLLLSVRETEFWTQQHSYLSTCLLQFCLFLLTFTSFFSNL